MAYLRSGIDGGRPSSSLIRNRVVDIRGDLATGGKLLLTTTEPTVVDGNELGRIDFQAPLDTAGTDAILVAASIYAEADATFSSSVNSTDLVFATGDSGTASEKLRIDSTGQVTFADGAIDVDISSHDTSNGLKLGGTLVSSTAAELNKLDGVGTLKEAGKESIWIPAVAMYPSTTNPCADHAQVETTALRPDLKVLDFATGADDFAQFSVAFPKSWNEGTVTFQPFWTVTGTNTGTVAWALAGIAVSSDDTINTAFGTAAVTTALAHSGTSNDLMVSVESGAITIAGSPAAADCCFFQISRDVSAVDQSGSARLIGIKLFFTTDAANDD
jgi:hypothetical protein